MMQFIKQIPLSIVVVLFLTSCGTQKNLSANRSISSLRYVDQYEIPYNLNFKQTTVGGLSGIDYNSQTDSYYMICDDRSEKQPARFYTASIKILDNKIDTVIFINVNFLKMQNGNFFPNAKEDPHHAPDPEALRFNAGKGLQVWSSEGERIVTNNKIILADPFVLISNSDGSYKDSFSLPENMRMSAMEKGPRKNGVFEGLTFDERFKNLYVSVEEPIFVDGPKAGLNDSSAWTRIIQFDVAKRKATAQFAYPLDAVAHAPFPTEAFSINGVTDILFVEKNKFLTIERSFSTGRLSCTVKVFLTDITNATNISDLSLKDKPAFRPATKRLLLNTDSLGIFVDNIEGVTFGPVMPNGHRSLLFITDNNFAAYQLSQIFLFEIIP